MRRALLVLAVSLVVIGAAAPAASAAPAVDVKVEAVNCEEGPIYYELTLTGFTPFMQERAFIEFPGTGGEYFAVIVTTDETGSATISGELPVPPGAVIESGEYGVEVDLPFDVLVGSYTLQCPNQLPTSTEQCKDAGFKDFEGFGNQGECVSFVATEGKNEPGKNEKNEP